MAKGVMMRKFVVAACVLTILVSAALLVGCSGGSSTAQGPQQAVQAFFSAMEKVDANTSWDLMSADSQKQIGSKADWVAASKESTDPMTFTVGKVTVNGDKATAKVTGTVSGKSTTQTIPLVKENGAWKVDIIKAMSQ
ncbi:MAG: Rv0361 family membrane protein [Candidatus Geothermincolia bacterium]